MDIHKIISILDRDDSLQLDNDEKTYQQEDEINDVDWDRLWELPSKETNEPWVLSDPDVIGTILGGVNGSAVPWPKDVQEKDNQAINMGKIVDCLLLEPEEFDNKFYRQVIALGNPAWPFAEYLG